MNADETDFNALFPEPIKSKVTIDGDVEVNFSLANLSVTQHKGTNNKHVLLVEGGEEYGKLIVMNVDGKIVIKPMTAANHLEYLDSRSKNVFETREFEDMTSTLKSYQGTNTLMKQVIDRRQIMKGRLWDHILKNDSVGAKKVMDNIFNSPMLIETYGESAILNDEQVEKIIELGYNVFGVSVEKLNIHFYTQSVYLINSLPFEDVTYKRLNNFKDLEAFRLLYNYRPQVIKRNQDDFIIVAVESLILFNKNSR